LYNICEYRSKFSSNSNFKIWGENSKIERNHDKSTDIFNKPNKILNKGWRRAPFFAPAVGGEVGVHLNDQGADNLAQPLGGRGATILEVMAGRCGGADPVGGTGILEVVAWWWSSLTVVWWWSSK
jgi:hypothetical protein